MKGSLSHLHGAVLQEYGVLDSQQLQLLEFEQDEFSSDVQDGVGMQQAEG